MPRRKKRIVAEIYDGCSRIRRLLQIILPSVAVDNQVVIFAVSALKQAESRFQRHGGCFCHSERCIRLLGFARQVFNGIVDVLYDFVITNSRESRGL